MLFKNGFPALYPILDSGFLAGALDRAGFLGQVVSGLAEAGVGILQYRNKTGDEAQILADGRVMRQAAAQGSGLGARNPGQSMVLILNDFPELVAEAGFDGVHVGQTDRSPAEARAIVGPGKLVGVSTHNEAQLRSADLQPVNYIAIGPVCATATKANPDPVVGLEGVRLARGITEKPLVAIGGISLENARLVRQAGADSVAVISAIFAPQGNVADLARNFLLTLRG